MRRSSVLITTLVIGLSASSGAAQMTADLIADGVVRFYASEEAKTSARPSIALLEQPEALGEAPADFPVDPVFSVADDGRHVASIAIEAGTSLYGTGEVAGQLLRNGRTITCWNFDAYGYGDLEPEHLYQSHPWVLAVRPDGTSYGVLADTTYRCEVDLTDGIVFRAQGPAYPVMVIERSTPEQVVKALGDLTGKMPMPPKWALGYHQCRYSYYPDERVREIADEFRSRDIPCDVIWMDIDYMRGFRCFTFSPEHFPDPSGLNSDLHDDGYHTVWMIDPGIKAEPGYFVYDQGTERDVWVKAADGSTYIGEVWPGDCVFPDYTNADVREWWGGLYEDFLATGIDGVWNDMNEPAVFGVQSKTMPLDNWHRADPELGGPGPHAAYHNIYGMQMVRATREGVLKAKPAKRPFVLSRANYIGGQRYAATWTGDNTANWYHMESSVPMVLNLGLSGNPFTGPDIGGFDGNGPRGGEAELFERWMGIGALLPFSRGHTGKGNIDKEPWAFTEKVERTSRQALNRRYRLMPYLYTVVEEAVQTGMPICRPLFFTDPTDRALRSEDDAFLLGGDVLVVGKMTPGMERVVAMPTGAWRPLSLEESPDPTLPDLYVRPGSIVPTGPVMEYVDEKPLDPVTLVVNLDGFGRAIGELYEDAGDGWEYLDGEYRRTTYRAQRREGEVRVWVAKREGSDTKWPDRTLRVRLLRPDGAEIVQTGPDGAPMSISISD